MRCATFAVLIGLAALAVEAGASDEAAIAEAKERVAREMRDPESAQFRDIKVLPGKEGPIICGQVNAKNAYGGYVGFNPFLVAGSSVMLGSDTDPDLRAMRLELISHICNKDSAIEP